MAQCMRDDFAECAIKLVNENFIIKQLHSGTSILADLSHDAMMGIMSFCVQPKLVKRLFELL